MISGGEKGNWWRAYNSHFRQQLTSLDKAEFGRLDQALYTRSLLATAAGGAPKPATYPPLREQRGGGWQHALRSTMAEHVLLLHAAISIFVHAAVVITASRLVFILGTDHSHPPVLTEPARCHSQLVMVTLTLAVTLYMIYDTCSRFNAESVNGVYLVSGHSSPGCPSRRDTKKG